MTEQTGERRFPVRKAILALAGILLVVSLSLDFLSLTDDSVSVEQAPDGDEAPAVVVTESPDSSQEFSPQALEDLRPDPTVGLEIQPEPIIEPPPEPGVEPGVEEEPAVVVQEPTPQEGVQEPGAQDFSVGEAMARYLTAMQDQLNREYVEKCIQYRSRNGAGAGCPEDPALTGGANQEEVALVDELFAIITRRSDYARISEQLERENEALAAILDDPANPGAVQARIKMSLNNSYLNYLNGNPNPTAMALDTMNDFINDYNRTILSGPVQFRCKGGPCIYEYNGPGEK